MPNSDSGRSDELSIGSGPTRASIDLLGAHVRSVLLEGEPLVKPSSDGIQTHGGIAVLIPYAGRVKDGRYTFEGKRFQLPTRKDGHAIHGFAKDARWKVEAKARASVSLTATLRGRGYPGTLEASISYSVRDGTFSTDCAIRNAGRNDVPVVVGFHPYLVAERWSIEASPNSYHYQLADGYFPTGRRSRYSLDEAGPKARLDDCFYSPGTLRLITGGKVVALRKRNMPYLVVYNGKYAEGESVAIEPYSGLPDAYNNGIGVRKLSPGQGFRCGYDLTVFKI